MTIGAIVAWVSAQSVWWTLAIWPAIWILSWIRKQIRNELVFVLWCRNVKAKLRFLEKEIAAALERHDYNHAALCDWTRRGFEHLLIPAIGAIWENEMPHGAIDAFDRRRRAIEHANDLADDLAEDRAWIERRKRQMVDDYCAGLGLLGKDEASIARERAALLADHPEEFDPDDDD